MIDHFTFSLSLSNLGLLLFCLSVLTISLRGIFGLPFGFLIAALKLMTPIVYFTFFFDGTFTALDDWNYLEKSKEIHEKYGFSVLYDFSLAPHLMGHVGSLHYLNYAFQSVLVGVWGSYYYVPVFVNVSLTGVATLYLFKILILAGLGRNTSRLIALYFTLHISLIAWSSFMNLRDVVILTLTVVLFYCTRSLDQEAKLKFIIGIVVFGILMLFVRSYIPFIVLGLEACFFIFSRKLSVHKRIVIIFVTCIFAIYWGERVVLSGLRHLQLGPELLPGIAKFILTPAPWQVAENYKFLVFDAIQHWVMFPFMLVGAFFMFKNYPTLRPVFMYALVLVLLYSAVPGQNGPRYRLQFLFVVAPCQLYGLWVVFNSLRTAALTIRWRKQNTSRNRGAILYD